MFWTRLGSGIVLMALMIALAVFGGIPMFVAITLISVIGLYELYRTVGMEKTIPGVIGYLAGIGIDLAMKYCKDYYLMVLLIGFILIMACYVIAYPKFNAEQITMLIFGLVYVTTMMSFVFQVRDIKEQGNLLFWLIFIGAWGSDTCAYCVGKLFGKHKMPSKLSPNKTIEGCVGGVLGAALIGFVYAIVLFKDNQTYWWGFALIGAVASVISQIGDLTASAIKRNHDIKDYGKLIPGHGGILDRFDSIIFVAPVVYYLMTAIM